MDRNKLIRELESKKRSTEYRLKGKQKNKQLTFKDFCTFCRLEKEIEIQRCYLQIED